MTASPRDEPYANGIRSTFGLNQKERFTSEIELMNFENRRARNDRKVLEQGSSRGAMMATLATPAASLHGRSDGERRFGTLDER